MKSIMKIWHPIGAAILFSLQPLKRTLGMAFLFLAAASALSNPTPSSDAIIASASSDSIRVAVFGPDLATIKERRASTIRETTHTYTLSLLDDSGNPTRTLWRLHQQEADPQNFLLIFSKNREKVALTYRISGAARFLVFPIDAREVLVEERNRLNKASLGRVRLDTQDESIVALIPILVDKFGLSFPIELYPKVTELVEGEDGEWSLIAESGGRSYRYFRNPSGEWDAEPVE